MSSKNFRCGRLLVYKNQDGEFVFSVSDESAMIGPEKAEELREWLEENN